MSQTEPQACPHCKGTGSVGVWVQWSDGLGGSSATCSVCGGAGSIDFDPIRELARVNSLLIDLLYEAWLVAGCDIRSHEATRLEPHQQALRNDLLNKIKALPDHLHSRCEVRNRYREDMKARKAAV